MDESIFSLKGKTALVTGAGTGVGRIISNDSLKGWSKSRFSC